MAIVMKQQNRAEEAIDAIKSLRNRCSDQAQDSLDNIILDLYKIHETIKKLKKWQQRQDQVSGTKHYLLLSCLFKLIVSSGLFSKDDNYLYTGHTKVPYIFPIP